MGVRGYGTVRPSFIDNGGDPMSRVFNVSWQSWGGPTAIGTGTSYDDTGKPSVAQSVENQATVVAFDLGECKGQLMYRAIEWYFPSDGHKFDPNNYINICTASSSARLDHRTRYSHSRRANGIAGESTAA